LLQAVQALQTPAFPTSPTSHGVSIQQVRRYLISFPPDADFSVHSLAHSPLTARRYCTVGGTRRPTYRTVLAARALSNCAAEDSRAAFFVRHHALLYYLQCRCIFLIQIPSSSRARPPV
jgi:hypothetical protein